MHPRKPIPRCANCKEHLPVESLSTPPSDADPQSGTANVGTPVTVDYSGLAAHPVVAAILAVTPTRFDGVCALDDCALASSDANAHEIAAKQAAAVLRWLARDFDICLTAADANKVDALADEVEAAGTDTTTRSS